jgi:two-component system sensor histidine kinase/response regulator
MSDLSTWGDILVAEDSAVNQRVTRAMLENLGYRVDTVADGTEAVNAAASKQYRAILMDCQLLGLDGDLATTEIRRWRGASRSTPIIAVTASEEKADELRCLTSGMDDYLTKPLTMKTLAAVLAKWVPDPAEDHEAAMADGLDVTVVADVPADDPPTDLSIRVAPPVLDGLALDRLERLGVATGEDLVAQLTVLFLADADQCIETLHAAIARLDTAAVFRCAHTMTGASANLGALELARLCNELAIEAEAGHLPGGELTLVAIEAELDRARTALSARSTTP